MTELTPRERAAQRLLGIAALEKLLAVEKAAARAEAQEVFTRPGQREVAELPDGTPMGNVRLDKTKQGWQVKDPDRLLAWVYDHAEDQLMTVTEVKVAPSYADALLRIVEEHGYVTDGHTGEDFQPEALGLAYVTSEPRLVVTADKGAPEAVRRALGPLAGQLGIREVEA